MTSLLPAEDLFPSEVLFPGGAIAPVIDGVAASLNGLSLTGLDEFGVFWRTFAPIDGWDGSPASSMQPTQKTRAAGAWPGPRELTPRSIGLTGSIEAPNTDAAVDAMDRLNAAATLDASILTITRGSRTRSAIVYRQGAPAFSEINGDTNFGWSLDLVALEPRKFAAALTGTTGLPSSFGGMSFPLSFPMSFPATVVSGRVALTNPGNATGPIVLRIDGPITGPQVTHVGSGLTLVFKSTLQLLAGDWLDVDMEQQTALQNGQASRNSWISERGWFGFEPGPNAFAVAAESGSGLFTITGTPAWL